MFGRNRGKEKFAEGTRLGDYRLDRQIGEGGMGVVFLATRESDGQAVALKVLRRELARDEMYRKRFTHEVRAARATKNEHLVTIYDAGEAEGRHFIAVEYVPGGTLEDLIASSGGLTLGRTVQLTSDVAAGLDALHAAGVVHRDVKPSNILIRADGRAALTDFGLAKGRAYTVLTKPGQVMGTLDYLAPELIRGGVAGPASDIYALGCVVFECLSGTAPFGGKSMFEVGLAHLEEDPPDPCAGRDDSPPQVSWATLRALQKDPADRPVTATEFANLLLVAAEKHHE